MFTDCLTRKTEVIMRGSVAVIGAGPGGLTTALFLKKNGLNVTVYESAEEIRPVGAGIVMAGNAMQIFRELGLQEKIEQAGNKVSAMKITDEQYQLLSEMDLSLFEQKYHVHNVAVYRADLQRILAEMLGYEHLSLGKRLLKIKRKENVFRLLFEDGSEAEHDYLIGADGIKSVVREQLFGAHEIRNTGQICWRGLCEKDFSEKYRNEVYELWGRGRRFGFVQINSRQVYWYAVVNAHLVTDEPSLPDLFSDFHPEIQELIKITSADDIIKNEIIDLKPMQKWFTKNACLIGDAAHATTPNMGQGACQAIEDAYAVGQLLQKGKSLNETFRLYEQLRKSKAHGIVNNSWRLGKIAHLESLIAVKFRNFLFKIIPASVNKKQLEKVLDISYLK